MEKIKVKGHSNLYRDKNSNAILNTDMNEYENYIKSKRIRDEEGEKINKIESDLNSLKNDIDEIKFLLQNLVNEPK